MVGQLTQVVFKVKKDEVRSLKTLLLSREDIEQLGTTNPYEVFRVKYGDCLIIGYTTGKIVANKEVARQLISELLPKIVGETQKGTVIGSDEAGKGEWLGPIVVAAVAVNPAQTFELQAHGVMDSKELSLPKIHELASFIRNHHYLRRHVIITPRRFNELYHDFKDERKTLNDLLAWGHAKVIEDLVNLLPKIDEKIKVIIDEFDRIKTEERIRRVLDLKRVEVIQRPRAEENMAVAAASIIARDLREDYIDFLCKKLNKDLRTLTVENAIVDKGAVEYAKTSYLKKRSEK